MSNHSVQLPFVGREQQQQIFEGLVLQSTSPYHVLLVAGPPGIGKTYLLRKFQTLGQAQGATCLWLDLSSRAMDEATLDLSAQLTKARAGSEDRTTQDLLTIAGLEDLPLFSQLVPVPGDWEAGSRLPRRLRTIALQINQLSRQHKTILFVDAGSLPASDTRSLYGLLFEQLSAGTLIVLASRHKAVVPVSARRDLITLLVLESFSLQETCDYLRIHGISNKEIAASVFAVTRGLPLLVLGAGAYVVGEAFDRDRFEPIARRTLIDRAFQEIEDHRTHDLVRLAAVMRHFNAEALSSLSKSQELPRILDLLRECSFVEAEGAWLKISSHLRECLIQEWQSSFPTRFVALNRKVLSYYESLSPLTDRQIDQTIAQERIYHSLCISEDQGIDLAIRLFRRAELFLEVGFCRSIVGELMQYRFWSSSVVGWSQFCEASIARLEYSWQEARAKFEKLLESASSLRLRAYLLEGLSKTLRELGDWKAAEYTVRRAGEALDQLDHKDKVVSLLILGNLLTSQHRWEEALAKFNMALSITAKERDSVVDLQIHLALADLFRSQGQWDIAHDHLDRAMARAEKLNSQALQAQIWHSLGKLHRSRQDWGTAIGNYEQSIALREKIGDSLGQAQSLHSLGTVLLRIGRFEESRAYLNRSLAIKESIHDKFGIAKTYNSLGHIRRLDGDIQGALENYERSLQLFREVNNHTKASRVMCRIGMTLAAQGRLSEAVEYLRLSRDVRLRSSDRQGVAETLYELGLVQESSGDLPSARESFGLSLKFAKDSQSLTRELAPMIQLAILEYRAQDRNAGSEYLLAARQLASASRQFSLLANLLVETAKREAQAQRLATTFLCYAEATYAAAHERDEVVVSVLHEIVDLLVQVEDSQGKEIAGDFSYKLFIFWQKHCAAPPQKTRFWTSLSESMPLLASRNGVAVLVRLKEIQEELSGIEPSPLRIK